jgi:hypothetical protein
MRLRSRVNTRGEIAFVAGLHAFVVEKNVERDVCAEQQRVERYCGLRSKAQ